MKEADYLKKFRKLASINEAVVKQLDDTDDKFPSIAEEDANKDVNAPIDAVSTDSAVPPTTPATAPITSGVTSGATSGATNTSIPTASDIDVDASSPEASFDQNQGIDNGLDGQDIVNDVEETEEDIQNNILNIQVSAMKKMSDKIEELEAIVNSLNLNIVDLENEVEQVREPAPIEKLQGRWEDSYPFKYTLNDLWDGNVFQRNKDLFDDPHQTSDPNIKKNSDGTYEAQFEMMPKFNDFEIKKSFEVY